MSRSAVVIGASVAGLLASRVLTEFCEQVVLLDRDALPAEAVGRRGVPQADHLHGLLARGRDILDELFPGFSGELLAHGAISADLQEDIRWTIDGHPLRRQPCGLDGLSMSRSLLEHRIRARVAALPSVRIVDRCEVIGLATSADGQRVTGVRVMDVGDRDGERELAADLVVDASGRGSRSPVWLTEAGYPAPEEDSIRIGMAYATRHFRREARQLPDAKGAVVTMSRENPRGGAIASEEGNRWIVTLAGILGDDPPLDDEGFAAFAATLPDPRIVELVRTAAPLDRPSRARYPASVRRRYERLRRFPERFVVLGDAICGFNPVYGQGMTVAAEEALVLRECLRRGDDRLGPRFFRRAAKLVDVAWSMATSSDLRFDGVVGPRPLSLRLANGYLRWLGRGLEHDGAIGSALLRIANLLDRPQRLFTPGMIARVLSANLRARRRAGPESAPLAPIPVRNAPFDTTTASPVRSPKP
jgi:2-polyprenyl-6-methoxyphenol hydroxylase-like FAD-dependent oxidoreductase